MMKKIYLGLDLGIASVGWSLVDQDQNIIARGTHLFEEIGKIDNNNVVYGQKQRGNARRTRRILRRRKQRKIDFLNMIDQYAYNNQKKLLNTNQLSSLYKQQYQQIFKFTKDNSSTDFLVNEMHKYDIYKIYEKAFVQELTPQELFCFLYWKLANRGAFDLSYEKPENYGYEQSLFKTKLIDEYFKKRNKFKAKENSDSRISFFHNLCDVEYILNKQSYLSEEFKTDYLNIFKRQRDFSKGPGTEKSQTSNYASEWGISYDKASKKPLEQYIWDKYTGECLISKAKHDNPVQKRWNKFFFLSSLINFISQWIHVKKINEEGKKLSNDEIRQIANYFIRNDEKCTKTKIAKVPHLNLNENDLSGVPLDKQKISWNFDELTQIRNYFNKNQQIIKFINEDKNNPWSVFDILDDLIKIDKLRFYLMVGCDNLDQQYYKIKRYYEKNNDANNKNTNNNIDIEDCKQTAKQIIEDLINKKQIRFYNEIYEIDWDHFCNFNKFNDTEFSSTTSYGEEAYNNYINKFLNNKISHQNFNDYFKQEINDGKKLLLNFRPKSIYINEQLFKHQDFISPNAKNTIKEAIRIINHVFKKYIRDNDYELGSIILETTYDNENIKSAYETLLDKNKKEAIINYQSFRENQKKEIIKFAIEELNYSKDFGNNNSDKLKLKN